MDAAQYHTPYGPATGVIIQIVPKGKPASWIQTGLNEREALRMLAREKKYNPEIWHDCAFSIVEKEAP